MNTATFPTYDTVDLFAGPGGWSVAAQRLGLREIGLEFDKAAHMTRRAAGFHTIRDDVRSWGPANFPNARGLIASPPCQTFSAAGKGAGRRALDVVLSEVWAMHLCHQRGVEYRHQEWEDERTGLVLEPLRWALEAIRLGRPYDWLAFEQVPTVLPVWQAMAEVLRAEGYSVAVGNLQAEQYGVPQTRKRAVLIARRWAQPDYERMSDTLALPTPTHSRYHTRDKARLDPGVLPWVSMAQALGWGLDGRPSPTVTGGGTETGGAEPIAHLSRYSSEPGWQIATGTRPKAPTRPQNEPAPTLAFGHDAGSHVWTPQGMTPAEVVAWKAAHPVQFAGAGRTSVSRQNAEGSVRVSVEEAACLQSFPAGFPWQGSRTKQYQQIGNAIPPLLAEAVLAAVLGVPFRPGPGGVIVAGASDIVVQTDNITGVGYVPGGPRIRYTRSADYPAATVTQRTDTWLVSRRESVRRIAEGGGRENRASGAPAPTITGEAWEPGDGRTLPEMTP